MKKHALMAAVAALGLAGSLQAAVLHVQLTPTQMTNINATTGSSANAALIQEALTGTTPHDFKFTVSVMVDGLTGNQKGFGNLSGNVTVGTPFVRSTLAAHKNYAASGVQANQFGSPAAVFNGDADSGADTTDLQSIVVFFNAGIDPADGSADNGTSNYQLDALNGKYQPIGSFWLSYTGDKPFDANAVKFVVPQWSTSNGAPTQLAVTTDPVQQAPAIGAGLIPEPASIGLLGLGSLALAARRRRA